MSTIEWKKLGFIKNPFNVEPDREPENLFWAGFDENKNRFISVLESSLKGNDTKLILTLSRYGGGKTHASYYFSRSYKFDYKALGVTKPLHLIIKTPKEGANAPIEFFTNLIESIGVSNICNSVKKLIESENEIDALAKLQDWTESEDLGRIIYLLGNDNDNKSFDAGQALFGNSTKTTLKSLRVRRGVSSNNDRVKLICAIIQLISKYGEEKFEKPRRIVIWLDELESLVFYSSKQYRPFTQTIRDIIGSVTQNLTIFLNFSFADPHEVKNVEVVIGEALLDRVTEQIIFEETDLEGAKKYLSELMKECRKSDYEGSALYPFSEKSVDILLVKTPEKTGRPLMPRTINKACLYVIQQAFDTNILEKEDIISENFVDSLTLEEVSGLMD